MARRPWLILLVLPLLPLWQAVFRGKTIGPWEHIKVFAPWMGPVPDQPWDVLQADGALQFYVWRDLVFEAWRRFEVPFWNPFELMGTPLLANSQSGALYPPHILIGLLHVPTSLGVTVLAWAHLAWAAVGVFALARRLGATESGGLIAGASFALCPFMIGWTALASVISTVSWIPWVLWGCLDLVSRKDGRSTAVLASAVGMMLLSGHLQFCAYGLLAALVVSLSQVKAAGARGVALTGIGLVLGGFIAAPQLLPVLHYSQSSHRRNTPTEEGYQAYVASAIRPFEFGNWVNPVGLGDPRQMARGANVSTNWVPIVKPGGNFAESAVSPGAVAIAFLCLTPLALARLRPAWGLGLVGLLGLLLATGTPLARAFYFLVPGWSSTGSPGRAIVLFVLAQCVMAGIASGVVADPDLRPRTPKGLQIAVLGFVFLVAGTLGIGITGAKTPEGMDHNAFQALVGSASASGMLTTLLIAAVAAQPLVLGFFRGHGKGGANVGLLAIGAIVATALLARADRWVMVGDLPARPSTPSLPGERTVFVNEPWDLLLPPPANFPPNLAALFRLREAGGYDSLIDRDTVGLLRQANGGLDPAPPANGNLMFVKRNASNEALAELGATWKVIPKPEGAREGAPTNWTWERIEGPGRLSGAGTRIVRESLNWLEAEAEGPGTLVLRDRNLEGWSARIDGVPKPIPDGPWRTVDVPAGKHVVRFDYEPPRFRAGLVLFAFGLLGCLLMARYLPSISMNQTQKGYI